MCDHSLNTSSVDHQNELPYFCHNEDTFFHKEMGNTETLIFPLFENKFLFRYQQEKLTVPLFCFSHGILSPYDCHEWSHLFDGRDHSLWRESEWEENRIVKDRSKDVDPRLNSKLVNVKGFME